MIGPSEDQKRNYCYFYLFCNENRIPCYLYDKDGKLVDNRKDDVLKGGII